MGREGESEDGEGAEGLVSAGGTIWSCGRDPCGLSSSSEIRSNSDEASRELERLIASELFVRLIWCYVFALWSLTAIKRE